MKKLLLSSLLLLAACSTSNMSKNTIQEGPFLVKGGKFAEQTWDNTFVFNRISWYKELSMLIDINLGKMERKSPFYSWLSAREKEDMDKCDRFYIAVSYALDSSRLSTENFLDIMKAQGYTKIAIPHFASFLKLHPDYEASNLQLYDIYALCSTKRVPLEQITVEFPSFSPVKLK